MKPCAPVCFVRVISVSAIAFLAACELPLMEPRPTVTPVAEETVITSTASTTSTLVLDRNTDYVTCTAPAPDATFGQSEQANLSAALAAGTDTVSGTESTTSTVMPGRTPAVLMTRELFYRACEFSRNYRLTKAEAYDLYIKTLHAAAKGWDDEVAQTTVTIGETTSN